MSANDAEGRYSLKLLLVHGMGRSPLSLLLLGQRLRKHGHEVHLFAYFPTFESLEQASTRLAAYVAKKTAEQPYALLGHSLGSVVIRHALSKLHHQPAICFFLAPPMQACRAARFFSRYGLYRLLTGEMGQLLAQEGFMRDLPIPDNCKIYVGTGGPRRSWLPFGNHLNDGILLLTEAVGDFPGVVIRLPSTHTFIMNSPLLLEDMIATLRL